MFTRAVALLRLTRADDPRSRDRFKATLSLGAHPGPDSHRGLANGHGDARVKAARRCLGARSAGGGLQRWSAQAAPRRAIAHRGGGGRRRGAGPWSRRGRAVRRGRVGGRCRGHRGAGPERQAPGAGGSRRPRHAAWPAPRHPLACGCHREADVARRSVAAVVRAVGCRTRRFGPRHAAMAQQLSSSSTIASMAASIRSCRPSRT